MKSDNQHEARKGLQHCLDALEDMKAWICIQTLAAQDDHEAWFSDCLAQFTSSIAIASWNRSRL